MHNDAGVLGWVLALLLLVSCGRNPDKAEKTKGNFEKLLPSSNTAGLTGQKLAQGYCGSCHLFPEPTLLDKQTWKNGVLPNMGLRLGLDVDGANPYAGMHYEDILKVAQAEVFANKPLISQADWVKIVNYYIAAAPENPLPQQPIIPVNTGLNSFIPKPLQFKNRKLPLTTLAKFDQTQNQFFLGDKESNLFILDKKFNLVDSIKLESPASSVQVDADGSFNLLTLGVLEPSDRYQGKLTRYSRQPNGKYTSQVLINSLNRPVEANYTDLNQDGLTDIVICNYGNHTGSLVWFRNKGNGRYEENILKNAPGSRNVIIQDFNRDGRPDIMVLVAQSSENISIFFNQGQNKFEEKQVLRFPPVYGSSYVTVADWNKDGQPDILYANGDNADYSVALKKYHGLRIFLNDGKNNYKQGWFYPLHGASKAIAQDFDQDGDVDIAAIAFFPDFQKQPLNGFVYLENQGNLMFKANTFPEAATGRWLTLESGDVDQDGDQDLLLGSYISAPAIVPPDLQKAWFTSGPNMMVLTNNSNTKAK